MKLRRQGRGDAGIFSYVGKPIADIEESALTLSWNKTNAKGSP